MAQEVVIDKKISHQALITFGSRALSFTAQFYAARVVLTRFGLEALGLFSLLAQLFFLASLADLGLGGGAMRNTLASWVPFPEKQKKAEELFSSLFTLSCLVHILLAVLLALSLFLQGGDYFKIGDPHLRSLATKLLIVSGILLCLRGPLALSDALCLAYGDIPLRARVSFLEASLWIAIAFLPLSFKNFVLAWQSVLFLTSALGFYLALRRRGWRLHRLPLSRVVTHVRGLLKEGLAFWSLNWFHLIFTSQQTLIVSRLISAQVGGEFSLFYRLFSLLLGVQFTLLTPLWSAYTTAKAQSDWVWMRHQFKRSLIWTLTLFSGVFLFLALFYTDVIQLWTGERVNNPGLLVAMMVWTLLMGWSHCCSTLLNGLGLVRGQLLSFGLSAIIHWLLAPILADSLQSTGIVLSSVVSLMPYIFWTTRCAFLSLKLDRSAMSP